MKQERIVYKNGKFPNDVRNVVVSDYKDVLSIGNSVMIEGKKWIVIAKEASKLPLDRICRGNTRLRTIHGMNWEFFKSTMREMVA